VRILTVNAGSTSLKLEAYELSAALPPIGEPPEPVARYAALEAALAQPFDAVAHRIVRVPDDWGAVTLLDPKAQFSAPEWRTYVARLGSPGIAYRIKIDAKRGRFARSDA
jgi:hypothetical protein